MGDDVKAADTQTVGTQTTAPAAAGSTGDGQAKGKEIIPADQDWEKRFKGLQPVHQKLVEDHNALMATYKADQQMWLEEKTTFQEQVSGLTAKLGTATTEVEGMKTSKTELDTTIHDLERQLERNALIMSDYPDLAVFEAKGLISTELEGNGLIEALNSMREVVSKTGAKAVRDLSAGMTTDVDHKSGARTQGAGVADLTTKIMEAQKRGDFKAADELTAELLKQAQTTIFGDGTRKI